MDLREARVGERRALAVRTPGSRDVARHGVGRQVEHVRVAAGGQHDRVGAVRGDLTGHQVTDDDAACAAVDHDDVQHLRAGVQLDLAGADLPCEGLVRTEQQLLPRLAAGVEGAADLRATERAVGELAAVLAGERHALRGGLVDDVVRHLGQSVDVGLAGAVVAALDRVVEQAEDRVTVTVVVLRGVDPALGGDRVRATSRVVEREGLHVVAQFGHRGGGRRTCEAGPDDDDVELPLVVRVDQAHLELVVLPHVLDRLVRDLGVERHGVSRSGWTVRGSSHPIGWRPRPFS